MAPQERGEMRKDMCFEGLYRCHLCLHTANARMQNPTLVEENVPLVLVFRLQEATLYRL